MIKNTAVGALRYFTSPDFKNRCNICGLVYFYDSCGNYCTEDHSGYCPPVFKRHFCYKCVNSHPFNIIQQLK